MNNSFRAILIFAWITVLVSNADATTNLGFKVAQRNIGDRLEIEKNSASGESCRCPLRLFSFTPRNILFAGSLVSLVALSSTIDQPISSSILDLDEPYANTLSDVGHCYQNSFFILGSAASLYAFGWTYERSDFKRVGLEIIEAFALAGVGTQIIKHLAGRARPFTGDGPGYFTGPTTSSNKYLSFISGDVTSAFALSTVLSEEMRSLPFSVFVYSLASATAFQRIYTDQHWFSDTVGGAIWATAIGIAVVKLNHANLCCQILPDFRSNGVQIILKI